MRDPIHPGEALREDLDALGMSAAGDQGKLDERINEARELQDSLLKKTSH